MAELIAASSWIFCFALLCPQRNKLCIEQALQPSPIMSARLVLSQVVIFVKSAKRAETLGKLLESCQFPACVITSTMRQPERLDVYK